MRRLLRALLEHRFTPLAMALLAMVLTLPALRAGLMGDDYFHRMILLGKSNLGKNLNPTFDLFSFVPESQREAMKEIGILPWWADPNVRVALARPLSAKTHVIDYAFWPENYALQHLHSLLWFGLGVALVAVLYQRIHGVSVVAGMAALFFAVEDAHTWPAGWLANRNALLCLVCGTGVILLHVAWRRSGKKWLLIAALAALALGLGCGEATLGALAYVAAWQATEERGSWIRRLVPLAPYAVVIGLWQIFYLWFGYGLSSSSLYVNPFSQPLGFLTVLVERWPLLVAAQWFQAPVDLWLVLSRGAQVAIATVAAAMVAGLLALLWRLLRQDRLARFWLLGMALSLIPACAAFPMARLLIFPGIGAFGVLAMLIQGVSVWPWKRQEGMGWRRSAALVLLLLHGPLAASLLFIGTALLPATSHFFAAGALQSPKGPEVADQTFVFVNGNTFPIVYTWVIRKAEGLAPAPRRIAHLSSGSAQSLLYRENRDTLLITPQGGFFAHPLDGLLANPTHSFSVGDRIECPDYVVELRSVTPDGRPRQVAFRFLHPLESSAYRWLYWQGIKLMEFMPPGVGESMTLKKGPTF